MRRKALISLIFSSLVPAMVIMVVMAVICSVSVSSAVAAGAAEVKRFAITHFEMHTTKPTTEVPLGESLYEFVNEPYTYTQAGGHPWALTTTIDFASEHLNVAGGHFLAPTRDVKDSVVDLPPGLLGNPMATPRCPLVLVFSDELKCPSSTQVGVYRIQWFGGHEALGPIVNVVPETGQSGEFALENEVKASAVLTGHLVRTSQGYGLTVVANAVPAVEIVYVETTFWGIPADSSHDAMRGLVCINIRLGDPLQCAESTGGHHSGETPVPFLTMPTNCSAGPEAATVRADSWEEPGHVGVNGVYEGYIEKEALLPGATGCNALQFAPTLGVDPDTTMADEPVGLGLDIRVPLSEEPEANATPQLRNSVLTLPEGLSISPGVVDGIQACDASGPNGIDITGPESEEVGLNGELQLAAGHCPDASTVGIAEAFTPLLPVPVKGHIYLARPGCGGSGQGECTEEDARNGNLYRLYLELGGTGELAGTGVHFKVPLETEANLATGQLSTKVVGTPQTPFSDLKVRLNGGPRAPLDTPAVCGPAVTTADFTPWSAPGITPAPESLSMPGTPDATPSSFFDVTGCSSPEGLSPGFLAGTVTPQAGQFSSFTLNLSRQDREQYVKGIQVHTPPGLLGMLSSVPLCEEPAADAGTCPEASKIGTTRVASGAGSHPFEIEGNVYLTKSYGGAPFGLSVVTKAVAGPFNLGLVVVRARIQVDPENSTLRITTDETGPYALPQIIFGVPLRLQRITVNIDRPNFMFNPTNCAGQQITARISGSGQATASVSSPFAVGGCKSLGFKPVFKVSTSGHTSRAKGASLDAKVSYPAGSMGNEANIARVKVDLPKQLPSRLTTLQKACPDATFTNNPAACPPASIVGAVRAHTPLLPVGLSGPVYFVSHGGEAFPSLIVVLQGDGVRVDLTGTTFISKAGITSSTFKTVPDVPVNTFELYLPEGRYSGLAANGNLCKQQSKLKMPTEFVAQNGIVLKQTTQITVSGCPKAKAASKTKTRTSKQHGKATKSSGRSK